MINVVVTYTIPEDFVPQNEENIAAFLKDFEQLNQSQFSYRILKGNGNTFIHISKYANQEIQHQLLNIPSFLEFQRQRDESCEDIKQTIEAFDFVSESGNFR